MSTEPLVKNSLPAPDAPVVAPAAALPVEGPAVAGFAGLLRVEGILDRLRAIKSVLRLKPFDTATEEGRSQERYRRAAWTTVTSVLAKAVTALVSLLTVRLTIHYLGTERYGLWMTITSVVSLLMFADFGIGNGLLNAISDARGRDDVESVHKYVSSAFFVLLGIAVLLMGLFAVAYPFVAWARVFNVSSPVAARESGPAVFVFLVCFLLNIPLDVVQRVQTGHQEGYATNFWTVIGSLSSLACLLVVMHGKGGLPWLILAVLGGQLLGIFGNWGQEFGFTRPELLPSWTYWDRTAAHKILGTGILFFILQACSVFTIPVDNIVITQTLGPEAVTQFAVPMRLFILLVTLASMFVVPLWPAYGEAVGRGDVKWVKSTFFHSLGYSALIFGPAAFGMAALGKPIVRFWVGTQVHPTFALLFGMAAWAVLNVVGNAIYMFLCGINVLKFMVVLAILQAIGNLGLKIVMAKAFGITGVIWAAVLISILAFVISTAYVRGLLTKMVAKKVSGAGCQV